MQVEHKFMCSLNLPPTEHMSQLRQAQMSDITPEGGCDERKKKKRVIIVIESGGGVRVGKVGNDR